MFKTKFNKVLQELNLAQKAADGKLTKGDWKKIAAKYQELHGTDMYSDLDSEDDDDRAAEHDRALSILTSAETTTEGGEGSEGSEETGEEGDGAGSDQGLATRVGSLVEQNRQLSNQLNTITGQLRHDNPGTIDSPVNAFGRTHTESHAFGVPHDMFSTEKRWNKISVNPAHASLSAPTEEDGKNFRSAVRSFGSKVAERMQALHQAGLLNKEAISSGLTVDFGDLANAGLGEQYVIRRVDALISRIVALPTVYDLFPRQFGVQDRELMTNAFYGEFSQAYQEGEVWKGDVEIKPETGHVDDAMFKTLFKSMKWIERQYIGYLNKEGSDPVKWSMIEWMVLDIAKVLMNEQYKRKIKGIFVKPESGVPGHFLFAGTGVIYTLIRYYHENKLLPLSDLTYATYDNTASVFVEASQAFVEDVREMVGELDGYALYLNKNHKQWYKSGLRKLFGKDNDFEGPDGMMVPDTDIPIKWVPNMGQEKLMFMQKPGNIKSLEYLPGEMLAIKFQQDMENVKSWSTWKEGTAAEFVGKQFNNADALLENNGELQEVFINKPLTELAKDAATIDGSKDYWFGTIANTDPGEGDNVNITDITNPKSGVAYIVECGSADHPQTIKKLGKFDTILEDYVPVKVGDYLMVIFDKANTKFKELERCVNGVRTINAALQPNIPGAR